MDFGMVSLEGLAGSSLDPEAKQKWYGSGFKQERSGGSEEDDWRSPKQLKSTTTTSINGGSNNNNNNNNCLSFFTRAEAANKEPQMLSFSCPKPEGPTQKPTLLPFFHLSSSDYYSRGSASGSLVNSGGSQLGVFTQSQWMELEQQALIYKYITANVPIPSNLLLPIPKAVESARMSFFPSSLIRPTAFGWGGFHLGYSGSSDLEPGRCRRTDGKKWRCSRDAVADQKYCERHMNRGRHRSRKPVEGQSGHSAAASATTTKNAKLAGSSSSQASMVVGSQGSSVTTCLPITYQPASSSSFSQSNSLSRTFLEKENLVSAESFLCNSRNSSSLTSGGNFGSVDDLASRGTGLQHPVRQCMDDWTNKNQSDCSVVSWPQLDLQSDTHLSISIPMATADYMSSTSSPANNERPLSSLRLSRDVDPIQMGLGISSVADATNQRQASWIPISWGTSMGGPLGEVLNNTSSINSGECRNSSSALNLMTEGWDGSSRMGSSPTGVLQKTTFTSLSNSSAGSSPRADNNKSSERANPCNDHGLVNRSSAPSAF